MDIRQLRYFVGIVEAKSFSKAALNLHVAQPALSLHVRNMEADLGTELLLRTPQGIVPTETGLILLERARGILADFEATKRAVAEHDAEPSGEVRLGLPGTISEILSVPLILKVRERHPRVRLKVAEAMSGYVLDWLFEGRVDLGLLYLAVDERGLKSAPVLSERLCLFGPADGFDGVETADGRAVDLAELCRLPLVLPGAGHGLRALIEAELEARGLALSTVIEVDSYAAIKELVARGLGLSILPVGAVAREVEAGRFRALPVGTPPLARTVHLVHPFDRPATKAASAVEALVGEVLDELVATGGWKAERLKS